MGNVSRRGGTDRTVAACFRVCFVLCLLAAPLAPAACGDTSGSASDASDAGDANLPTDGASAADGGDAAPVPRGDRMLGIGVDPAAPGFFGDLATAHDAGRVGAADMTLAWDRIERPFDAGDEAGADAAVTALFEPALHVARLALESERMPLVLALDAVDVTGPRLPVDLAGRPLDDPGLATRSDALLDYVLGQLDTVTLRALLLASDVDATLGDDDARWAAFGRYVAHASAHAKSRRPSIATGFGVTADGLLSRGGKVQAAAGSVDLVAVSYALVDAAGRMRPVADVARDLASIAAATPPGKRLVLRAVGCPTAAICGGDETSQAAFIRALFTAWDVSGAQIPVIALAPLGDATEEAARAAAARLGRSDPAFIAMLGSLGLRTTSGREKPAFGALAEATRARDFR